MTSTIKVDNIQKVSDASNIIKKCGSTITLGSSGQTVAIACGATTTGMGRTGTVDWQTSSIKTSGTFTAVSGEGYFCDTSSGAITVNLPAGVAGAIVGLKDYAGTWDSNAVTLNPNGTDKIGGGTALDPTLTAEGGSVLLVFVDSTQGWLTTQQSVTESPSGVETFIVASGGNTTITCGNFKTHIFTGDGTFTVSAAATCAPNNIVDYAVIAGAGGGGSNNYGGGSVPRGSGGGGAGGFRIFSTAPGSNSPLNNSGASPNTTVTVTAQAYPITVGGGGAGAPSGSPDGGSKGNDSVFSTVTSAFGGAGGGHCNMDCRDGGSGGGGRNAVCGGSGNTPPVAPPQGNDGGDGAPSSGTYNGSGGGGAGAVGSDGNPAGTGGAGSYLADPFIGPTAPSYGTPGPVSSTRYFAGGGAGSPGPGGAVCGGVGGGGPVGTVGTINTGSGGGADSGGSGSAGGSGIVMIRYKFQ
jgi:hypothetical protein